jgi:hypothetical protein
MFGGGGGLDIGVGMDGGGGWRGKVERMERMDGWMVSVRISWVCITLSGIASV